MSLLTLIFPFLVSDARASGAICTKNLMLSSETMSDMAVRAARVFYGDGVVRNASVTELRRPLPGTRPYGNSATVAVTLDVDPAPLQVYAAISHGVVRKTGVVPFVARDWMDNRHLMARQPDPVFVDHLRQIILTFITSTVADASEPAIRFVPVKRDEFERGILALAIVRYRDASSYDLYRTLAITEHAGRLVIGNARDVTRAAFLSERQHLGDAALNEFLADTARRFVKARRLEVFNAFAGVVDARETGDGIVAHVAVIYRRRETGRAWLTEEVTVRHNGLRVDVDTNNPQPNAP